MIASLKNIIFVLNNSKMNIVRTALLLIITLVVVPVFSYFFGTPLNDISVEALTINYGVCYLSLMSGW